MIYVVLIILLLMISWLLYEWFEHQAVRFTRTEILSDNWSDKCQLKVFVISDLHNNQKYFERRLLERLKMEAPDVFLLSGDIVNRHQPENHYAIHMLEKLSEIAPIVYSYGNHESELEKRNPEEWKNYMAHIPKNCVLLNNESIHLSTLLPKKKDVCITGLTLPDFFYQRGKLIQDKELLPQLEDMEQASYQILLAHNPEYFELYQEKYHPDLIISGHLHGGIVRLPWIGGLLSPRLRLPKYDAGIRKIKKTTLFISKGFGSHTLWIRFLNRVEINQIIIRSEENNGNID